ncbi:MAG TPA: carboxypeptidase-like regulatory domain-containing protein, partial [Vicinamibacterales bacterium]|nr:carboxypeptidase-like regulatory domain-containing protein [Vicinamibacterales bacterium]
MTAVILFALALQTVAAQPPRQQAEQAPATIRGRVTTVDGRSLSNSHLRLTRLDAPQRPRNTDVDDDGAFEFESIPAGTYTLIANRSGFANSNALTVAVTPGETKEHVDVALRRLSAIAGRVVDDNGDPIEGASITAMRLRPGGGRRFANAQSRRTSELGRFRLYNLQPGDYVVSASLGSLNGPTAAMIPGYATTYFPGTMNPKDAQIVHVNAAEDVPGIDFSLIAVRTASIFGQMIGADGQPFQGGIQLAPSRRNAAVGGTPVGAITYRDGRFEFPNVAPGDYVIESTHNNE